MSLNAHLLSTLNCDTFKITDMGLSLFQDWMMTFENTNDQLDPFSFCVSMFVSVWPLKGLQDVQDITALYWNSANPNTGVFHVWSISSLGIMIHLWNVSFFIVVVEQLAGLSLGPSDSVWLRQEIRITTTWNYRTSPVEQTWNYPHRTD